MNHDLFGFEINMWFDAAARMGLITGLMTVVVMGLIYLERKVTARFQMRLGPTRTGPMGMLQSLADALKLVGKEDLRPANADPWVFELAVYFVFIPIFMMFVAIPFAFGWEVRVLELGLFYVIAISSVNLVGWVMAGWGSDNRYAMLGALRATAQAISYEIPLVLSLIAVAMVANSLNISEIIAGQGRVPLIVWQPLAFAIFFIAVLAELNRTPFDIALGESETAGGPHIEYSGIRWSIFFLAEYAALFLFALIGSAIFLGGWAWPLGSGAYELNLLGFLDWAGIDAVNITLGTWWGIALTATKTMLLILAIFWVRVTLPRLRIDQLMSFSWKVLMPLAFAQILVNGLILVYEWHDIFLLLTSGAGVVVLYFVIERGVRRPRPQPAALSVAAEGEAVA
ncbi:MAG TPA: NADH-quinone oxidoreductase subunit NuoH [Dehalococcoidia bacterium]|nr:NADH-quinone oxidoreductase subunit NuoH [Dehalococcoidia bacterium]